jgi:hypothetical protein
VLKVQRVGGSQTLGSDPLVTQCEPAGVGQSADVLHCEWQVWKAQTSGAAQSEGRTQPSSRTVGTAAVEQAHTVSTTKARLAKTAA